VTCNLTATNVYLICIILDMVTIGGNYPRS